jgi:hypothetical protein
MNKNNIIHIKKDLDENGIKKELRKRGSFNSIIKQ